MGHRYVDLYMAPAECSAPGPSIQRFCLSCAATFLQRDPLSSSPQHCLCYLSNATEIVFHSSSTSYRLISPTPDFHLRQPSKRIRNDIQA